MATNTEHMAQLFNSLLGNKIGRPQTTNVATGSIDPRIVNQVALRSPVAQKYFTDQAKARASVDKAFWGSASASAKKTAAAQKKADIAALKSDISTKTATTPKHKSIFEKIAGAVGKPFDVLSRPQYAVDEAMRKVTLAINKGEPIWSLPNDVSTGLIRGLSGTKKTSFGQIMEAAKQGQGTNSRLMKEILPFGLNKNRVAKGLLTGFPVAGQLLAPTMYGPNLKKFEDKHPLFAKWEKPITDLAGSIATDPLTYVGPGVLTKGLKGFEETSLAAKAMVKAGEAADIPAAKAIIKTENAAARAKQFQRTFDAAKSSGTSTRIANKAAKKAAEAAVLPHEIAKQRVVKGVQQALNDSLPAAAKKITSKFPDARSITGFTRKTGATHLNTFAQDTVDNLLNVGRSGAMGDSAIHGIEAPGAIASSVAVEARNVEMNALQPAMKRIEDSITGAGKALTSTEIANMKAANPRIKEYYDNIKNAIQKSGGQATKLDLHKNAYNELTDTIDKEYQRVHDEILANIGPMTHHTPTVRYLQSTGEIGQRIGNGLAKTQDLYAGSNLATALSYKKAFPGYTSMISQHVRSKGVAKFDQFYQEVKDASKGIAKEDRIAVHEALLNGHTMSDPKLEQYRQFIQGQYDKIRTQEIQYGVRSPNSVQADNFAFHWVKNGGMTQQKQAVHQFIKDTISATGSQPTAEQIIAKFPDVHLEKDATKALLLKMRKSIHDANKMGFNNDLVTQYHIVSKNMSEAAARAQSLVKVDAKELPIDLRQALKPGESYYLPQKVADVRKQFNNVSKVAQGSEVENSIVRSLDTLTKYFKTGSTIYFPSYHVRNMSGDVIMGALDGVKAKDYAEILAKGGNKGLAKTVSIGGESWPMSKLVQKFDETSQASGFMRTEIGRGSGRQAIQQLSEKREDLGRLVHFKHALDEEFAAVKGAYPGKVKLMASANPKVAEDARSWLELKAEQATRARVNKYKFDYSALTPFEQKYAKRVIPFYTYMRKAAPALVESMATNPRFLNNTNRVLNQFQPGGGFNEFVAPEWMRAIGYSVLPGQQNATEPWVFRHDMLPTNIFNDYTQQSDSSNLTQSITGNILSRINPVVLAPIEAAMGKEAFTGKKVTSLPQAYLDKIRPLTTFTGLTSPNKSLKEKLIGLSGLSITPIRKGSQKQYIQEVRDVNQAISGKGFKVFLSGSNYVLKDKDTGKVLRRGKSMADVLPELLRKKNQTFVSAADRTQKMKQAAGLSGTKLSDLQDQLKVLQGK